MEQSAVADKFHIWLFGLIYPAFLGTVLVSLFSTGFPWPDSSESAWEIALIVYFLTQFGEGIRSKAQYGTKAAAFDFVEVAAMVVAFFCLGSLSVLTSPEPSWFFFKLGVSVALLAPPIKRYCLKGQINSLSVLSVAAMLATWLPGYLAVIGFAVALGIYVIGLLSSKAGALVEEPFKLRSKETAAAKD